MPLGDGANDFALALWDGPCVKSSIMDGAFRGVDFALWRAGIGTSSTCGDSHLEGPEVSVPCGTGGGRFSNSGTTSLVAGPVVSSVVCVLRQQPIGRRKNSVEARVDDFWYARRMESCIYRRADTRVHASLPQVDE